MKLLSLLSTTLAFFCISFSVIFAQPYPTEGCPSVGACSPNGFLCELGPYQSIVESDRPCSSEVIGRVIAPAGIAGINAQNPLAEIAIFAFINRVVLFITIVAGLFVMFNFIKAGWMFLTAGDNTKAAGEVKDVLTYSVIGLVIIAITYTIAGLIGLLFFGDAGFILNPQLESALGTS